MRRATLLLPAAALSALLLLAATVLALTFFSPSTTTTAPTPPHRDTTPSTPQFAACRRFVNYSHHSFPPLSVYSTYPPPPARLLYTKVPKSGSTTVSAMLRRYCHSRARTVLLPHASYVLRDEAHIRESMRAQGVRSVDALLSHIKYNETMVRRVLGGDHFRIASVREPVDRLKSSYYYGRRYFLKQNKNKPFVCSQIAGNWRKWARACKVVPQLDYMAPRDWDAARRADTAAVLAHYHHVMVSDRMTESIVALAGKLGMGLTDMLVVSLKRGTRSRLQDAAGERVDNGLARELQARVEREGKDLQLYKAAVARLDAELEALPRELREAVPDLEAMTEELGEYCAGRVWETDVETEERCVKEWMAHFVDC